MCYVKRPFYDIVLAIRIAETFCDSYCRDILSFVLQSHFVIRIAETCCHSYCRDMCNSYRRDMCNSYCRGIVLQRHVVIRIAETCFTCIALYLLYLINVNLFVSKHFVPQVSISRYNFIYKKCILFQCLCCGVGLDKIFSAQTKFYITFKTIE